MLPTAPTQSPLPAPPLLQVILSRRAMGSFSALHPAGCAHCFHGGPIWPPGFNYHLNSDISQTCVTSPGFSPKFHTYRYQISNSTCLKFNCCSCLNLLLLHLSEGANLQRLPNDQSNKQARQRQPPSVLSCRGQPRPACCRNWEGLFVSVMSQCCL